MSNRTRSGLAPDQLDNRADETLQMLRSAAVEQGMTVSGDDRISEASAAARRRCGRSRRVRSSRRCP
jgi:hypothetical protein